MNTGELVVVPLGKGNVLWILSALNYDFHTKKWCTNYTRTLHIFSNTIIDMILFLVKITIVISLVRVLLSRTCFSSSLFSKYLRRLEPSVIACITAVIVHSNPNYHRFQSPPSHARQLLASWPVFNHNKVMVNLSEAVRGGLNKLIALKVRGTYWATCNH